MSMNQAKKLPDVYRHDTDSNNYKLMQLCNLINTDFEADMKSIFNSRDIHNATGKTLDRYGEMLGQSRNGATDEQYRFLLLNKIGKLKAGSDCNSVIQNIMIMFNAEKISVTEGNLSVSVNGVTMDMIDNTGYSAVEVKEKISEMLPVGVELSRLYVDGTLLISDIEEYGADYPVLYNAWRTAYKIHLGNPYANTGLTGKSTIPMDWDLGTAESTSITTQRNFPVGGTLGLLI